MFVMLNENKRVGSGESIGLKRWAIDFKASYNDDGFWADGVGFYISKGYALSTDTITLEELINGANYDSKISI